MRFIKIIVVFLVVTFSGYASGVNSSLLEKSKVELKLKITHTVYTAIIADYFHSKFDKYDPAFLADRVFFITFLNTWMSHIETKKYQSTQEIFAVISKQSPQFTQRFYSYWYLPHDVKKNSSQLYARRWMGLANLNAIYSLEHKHSDPIDYTKSLLRFIRTVIHAHDRNLNLSSFFYESFKNTSIKEIDDISQSVSDQEAMLKGVDIANLVFSLGVGGNFVSKFSILNRLGVNSYLNSLNRLSKPLHGANHRIKITSSYLLSTLSTAVKRGLSLKKHLNPFNSFYHTLAYSTAAHAGGFAGYVFREPLERKFQETVSKIENIFSNEDLDEVDSEVEYIKNLSVISNAFSLLSDFLYLSYPEMFDSSYKDFNSTFSLKSKGWIIETARNILHQKEGVNPYDFIEVILQAEKLKQLDKRHPKDLLAMSIIDDRLNKYQIGTQSIFSLPTESQKIESFRQMLIEGHLKSYVAANPSITSLLLDWGGNCVAETALMTALLFPYRERLPKEKQLAIYLNSRHIESTIFDEGSVLHMVSGKRTALKSTGLLKPEYLMLLVLRDLGVATSKDEAVDLVLNRVNRKKEESFIKATIQSFEWPSLSDLLDFFKREGSIFDTFSSRDNLNKETGSQNSSGRGSENPDFARREYSKSSEKILDEVTEVDRDYYGMSNDSNYGQSRPILFDKVNNINLAKVKKEKKDKPKINIIKVPTNQGPVHETWVLLDSALSGDIKVAHEELFKKLSLLNMHKNNHEDFVQDTIILTAENYMDQLNDWSNNKMSEILDNLSDFLSYIPVTGTDPVSGFNEQLDEFILVSSHLKTVYELHFKDHQRGIRPPIEDALDELNSAIIEVRYGFESKVLALLRDATVNAEAFVVFYDSLTLGQKSMLNMILSRKGMVGVAGSENHQLLFKYLFYTENLKIIPDQDMQKKKVTINPPVIMSTSYSSSKRSSGGGISISWNVVRPHSEDINSLKNDDQKVVGEDAESNVGNMPAIKSSTLIELSLRYGAGYHLWTDSTIQQFLNKEYDHSLYSDELRKMMFKYGIRNYRNEKLLIIEKLKQIEDQI